MLKHVAKIDKNIKTHFISSNKYFTKVSQVKIHKRDLT